MSLAKNIVWSPSKYAEAAVLAREVGAELLSRLDLMTIKPKVILDVGCGKAELSMQLQQRYPEAQVLALDQDEAMLQYAKQQVAENCIHYLSATAETLPFADQSVDLICANLLLPWHADAPAVLREWRRVLRAEGLLIFTVLGPDSLVEVRDHLGTDAMPYLADMHDVGDALLNVGFADPVLDVNYYTMTYREKNQLLEELSASGMWFQEATAKASVTTLACGEDGTWPVTYEMVFVHTWVPMASAEQRASADGLVRVPVASLRRRLRGEG